MSASQRKYCTVRSTLKPCKHPPGSLRKFQAICLRASLAEPLFDSEDAPLKARVGYTGELLGGSHIFIASIVEQDLDGEIACCPIFEGADRLDVKPEHQGRVRTEAEKAKAATAESRADDAARKRLAREERRRQEQVRKLEEARGKVTAMP